MTSYISSRKDDYASNRKRRPLGFTLCLNRRTIGSYMSTEPKSNGQLARAATNLGIGVVGLVIVRLIVQALPIFQDAGWIVKEKLTVVAGAVIVVDAILFSVLIGFAIQLRAYLIGRFSEVPGFGTLAANLVFLVTAGIAYTDFKPLIRAWPSIK